jgi:hypothetical protein
MSSKMTLHFKAFMCHLQRFHSQQLLSLALSTLLLCKPQSCHIYNLYLHIFTYVGWLSPIDLLTDVLDPQTPENDWHRTALYKEDGCLVEVMDMIMGDEQG